MRVTPPFGKMRFIPHKLINQNSGYERYGFGPDRTIATGVRVFLFEDGSKCWRSNTTEVAKQLCQIVCPDLTICQSEPRHTLNEKCRSDRALTASYAACSTYPR
jgi:hypothetical protein